MADNDKRYYWLKLKRDFFKRHDIRIIEAMPNGKDYILFYLKLLCESVDHNGTLRFNDQIPYNEEMLSAITNTNVDVVRSAIKLFANLNMIEILDDGTLYMNEVQKLLGTETYWAEKKRTLRNKLDNVQENWTMSNECPTDVQEMSKKIGQCPTCPSKSIDKDIDIDKDKELEKEKEKEKKDLTNYQKIIGMYNDTCVSFPRVTALSEERKKAIKARLKKYSEADFQTLFTKAEASDFLKGQNNRNWSANFDWLIKDTNMAKVLDGNYDNRQQTWTQQPKNRLGQELEESYRMMEEWAAQDEGGTDQ